MNIDHFISNCSSFSEFFNLAKDTSINDRGNLFERLTQLYLQSHPKYVTQLSDVWMLSEVPQAVKKHLRLPNTDEGIDLIAKTHTGEFWAVQSKFRSNIRETLKWGDKGGLSSFTALTFTVCKNISFGLVVSTVSQPLKKTNLTPNVGFELYFELQKLDDNDCEGWQNLKNLIIKKSTKVKALSPRKHQSRVLNKVNKYFDIAENSRGKIIMPCGTGKSLIGFWIAQNLNPKNVVIAVPSLALIKQTLNVWAKEFLAHNMNAQWLCVCSDSSAGKLDYDSYTTNTYDLGIPCVTDQNKIVNFLNTPLNANETKVIFTTYQSAKKLSQAAKLTEYDFDLCILDEAHKTVGTNQGMFSHLIHDRNIKINKRIFMTATERHYEGDSDDIVSMDDTKLYGRTIDQISFKEAIEKYDVICDYRFITYAISESELLQYWNQNAFINIKDFDLDKDNTKIFVSAIAVQKAFSELGIKRAISFHNSISKADRFMKHHKIFSSLTDVKAFHVSSKVPVGKRAEQLLSFEKADKALITNARCLTEGVDIPSVDCILFSEPRRSKVDIVQAAGRAMRKSPGKKFGYIIVPLIVPEGVSIEKFSKSTNFKEVVSVITSLASEDERIIEYFKELTQSTNRKQKSGDRLFDIVSSDFLSQQIDFKKLNKNLKLKVWDRTRKLKARTIEYASFEKARNYVRSLNLPTYTKFTELHNKDELPENIPLSPYHEYKDKGWIDGYDWIGKEKTVRNYPTYNIAKKILKNLNLRTTSEYWKFIKENGKNLSLHGSPPQYYKTEWIGWPDYLGYKPKQKYVSFKEARKYARSLNLENSKSWHKQALIDLPKNIPKNVSESYKMKGWAGWEDFLGWQYTTIDNARKFALMNKIRTQTEWLKLTKSEDFPDNIPKDPSIYQKWISYDHFLITDNYKSQFVPYSKAKKIAASLRLKNKSTYVKIINEGNLPIELPPEPDLVYKKTGWESWSIFGGTTLCYEEARQWARSLNLRNKNEWLELGDIPDNIPRRPDLIYKKIGWTNWYEWLGTFYFK